MALSGLDIYKLLPKTNCKECGFGTCLAFAMALAQKKTPLDKCPHVSAVAKEALESASEPPIRLLTIGSGDRRVHVGNETVMYRHELRFNNPAAVGFLIDDTQDDAEISRQLKEVSQLAFERAGQAFRANLVCVQNLSQYRNKFISAVKKAVALTGMAPALCGADAEIMAEALELCRDERPLVICRDDASIDAFIAMAVTHKVPLALPCPDVDRAAELTDRAKKAGLTDLVIWLTAPDAAARLQDAATIRRTALKKNCRALGYPVMYMVPDGDATDQLCEAASALAKYAGIVIMRAAAREAVYPLLVMRQDIYTDPQKPVQVEPRVYEVGKVTRNSPVLITTNFSITYFTVAGEVEASKVPSYIICCDAEGMSVLTAWAAEKFTPERIDAALKGSGIADLVAHRKVIIPGYVSVLSGKLEEVSGWKVLVGPREASGIAAYLRGLS